MNRSFFKKSLTILIVILLVFTISAMAEAKMIYLGSYNTGIDGSGEKSSAEIAKFNPLNQKLFVIVGAEDSLVMADMSTLNHKPGNEFKTYKTIELAEIVDGFNIGDISSVAVCKSGNRVAVAAQAERFDMPGRAILLDSEGAFINAFETGIQPDMITFTPDGKYILTADEGEPRDGYAEGTVDPKGSLSIINVETGVVTIVDFSEFDAIRDKLAVNGLILKKGALPSADLEPEYIGISEDSIYAYVSMQEANAVAKVEIATGTIEWLKGLGFKDHSQYRNALDLNKNDKKAVIKTEDVMGVYMPDGIDVVRINGKDYILTANEGDAREYGDEDSEDFFINEGEDEELEYGILLHEAHEGLREGTQYVFGARSFSIYDADTMEQVYDSGSDFEQITAMRFPKFFNTSNSKIKIDDRSDNKGPEPEDVKALAINDKIYAFIGLERIGGVMMYDITNIEDVKFIDYVNTRDFSDKIAGDVAPEGIDVVSAENSPTGFPLVFVANEVSGTVSVFHIIG
jgi:DNA-binding beta-propeller fold protein YncE